MKFKVKATETYTWEKVIEADSIEDLEVLLEDEFVEYFDIEEAYYDRDWEVEDKEQNDKENEI